MPTHLSASILRPARPLATPTFVVPGSASEPRGPRRRLLPPHNLVRDARATALAAPLERKIPSLWRGPTITELDVVLLGVASGLLAILTLLLLERWSSKWRHRRRRRSRRVLLRVGPYSPRFGAERLLALAIVMGFLLSLFILYWLGSDQRTGEREFERPPNRIESDRPH